MISFQLIASINHENMKLSLQTILISRPNKPSSNYSNSQNKSSIIKIFLHFHFHPPVVQLLTLKWHSIIGTEINITNDKLIELQIYSEESRIGKWKIYILIPTAVKKRINKCFCVKINFIN